MIRVTFELLPHGDEAKARTIGVMEVANVSTRMDGTADYAVILKKTPPFRGALQEAIVAIAAGHHRTQRGVYDLLYRALRACGLDRRNQ